MPRDDSKPHKAQDCTRNQQYPGCAAPEGRAPPGSAAAACAAICRSLDLAVQIRSAAAAPPGSRMKLQLQAALRPLALRGKGGARHFVPLRFEPECRPLSTAEIATVPTPLVAISKEPFSRSALPQISESLENHFPFAFPRIQGCAASSLRSPALRRGREARGTLLSHPLLCFPPPPHFPAAGHQHNPQQRLWAGTPSCTRRGRSAPYLFD